MSARNAFEENERLVEQMKLHVSENSRLQQVSFPKFVGKDMTYN